MVVYCKYWSLFLLFFLLLGVEINKILKFEEVKLSDSFFEVSVII